MSRPLFRVFLAISLLTAGCAMQPARERTLYDELGMQTGIERIVDGFLFQLADDEQVLPLFANTNIERFREKFIEHLCMVAHGPCEYTGDSMAETHRHMRITRAQFNHVVEDLVSAMETEGIPTGTQNALLKRLAALYGDVVYQ